MLRFIPPPPAATLRLGTARALLGAAPLAFDELLERHNGWSSAAGLDACPQGRPQRSKHADVLRVGVRWGLQDLQGELTPEGAVFAELAAIRADDNPFIWRGASLLAGLLALLNANGSLVHHFLSEDWPTDGIDGANCILRIGTFLSAQGRRDERVKAVADRWNRLDEAHRRSAMVYPYIEPLRELGLISARGDKNHWDGYRLESRGRTLADSLRSAGGPNALLNRGLGGCWRQMEGQRSLRPATGQELLAAFDAVPIGARVSDHEVSLVGLTWIAADMLAKRDPKLFTDPESALAALRSLRSERPELRIEIVRGQSVADSPNVVCMANSAVGAGGSRPRSGRIDSTDVDSSGNHTAAVQPATAANFVANPIESVTVEGSQPPPPPTAETPITADDPERRVTLLRWIAGLCAKMDAAHPLALAPAGRLQTIVELERLLRSCPEKRLAAHRDEFKHPLLGFTALPHATGVHDKKRKDPRPLLDKLGPPALRGLTGSEVGPNFAGAIGAFCAAFTTPEEPATMVRGRAPAAAQLAKEGWAADAAELARWLGGAHSDESVLFGALRARLTQVLDEDRFVGDALLRYAQEGLGIAADLSPGTADWDDATAGVMALLLQQPLSDESITRESKQSLLHRALRTARVLGSRPGDTPMLRPSLLKTAVAASGLAMQAPLGLWRTEDELFARGCEAVRSAWPAACSADLLGTRLTFEEEGLPTFEEEGLQFPLEDGLSEDFESGGVGAPTRLSQRAQQRLFMAQSSNNPTDRVVQLWTAVELLNPDEAARQRQVAAAMALEHVRCRLRVELMESLQVAFDRWKVQPEPLSVHLLTEAEQQVAPELWESLSTHAARPLTVRREGRFSSIIVPEHELFALLVKTPSAFSTAATVSAVNQPLPDAVLPKVVSALTKCGDWEKKLEPMMMGLWLDAIALLHRLYQHRNRAVHDGHGLEGFHYPPADRLVRQTEALLGPALRRVGAQACSDADAWVFVEFAVRDLAWMGHMREEQLKERRKRCLQPDDLLRHLLPPKIADKARSLAGELHGGPGGGT